MFSDLYLNPYRSSLVDIGMDGLGESADGF